MDKIVRQRGNTLVSILVLVALLINAIVIGAGGIYLWRNHKKEEALANPPPPIGAAETKTAAPAKIYYKKIIPFEGVITNLGGDNGRRILRMSLEVEFDGETSLTEAKTFHTQLRDAILLSATEITADEAGHESGRLALKQKILSSMNRILKKAKATNLYFTEFQVN